MLLRASMVLIAGLMFYYQDIRAQKPVFDTTERIYTGDVLLNKISTKAVRHFNKNYPDVRSEKWVLTSKGYVAFFINDSKIYRIYYGQRGEFRLSVITYYEGKSFPEELKRLVAIGYPDSEIENIVELSNGIELLYGITISNHQTFRLIEYSKDETKVAAEYTKQM